MSIHNGSVITRHIRAAITLARENNRQMVRALVRAAQMVAADPAAKDRRAYIAAIRLASDYRVARNFHMRTARAMNV